MKQKFLKSLFCIAIPVLLIFTIHANCQAKWTVMIYLDGDNNLEKYAINDFLEMSSVGSTSEVNFVVQFDRIAGYDTRYGNWTNTQRFRVTKDMEPTIDNAISDWGDGYGGRETNSGDPEVLVSFIKWAKQNYPAEHYVLILWDHGDGWKTLNEVAKNIEQGLRQPGISRAEKISLEKTLKELKRKIHARRYQKSMCFDYTSSDELTLKEIRQALSSENCDVDIIGFDACLMGMVEIAYELRSYAKYMVASEDSIVVTGYPYDVISQDIVNNFAITPEEFARHIVQHYADFYGHYSTETLSAINLSLMSQLYEAINSICASAIELDNQWIYFYIALSKTPHFDDQDYKDLKTFVEEVSSNASDPTIINEASNIIDILNNAIIENFGGLTGKGLSIYFPDATAGISPEYSPENLEFASGRWKSFLEKFSTANISNGFAVVLLETFDSGIPADWTIVDGNNDNMTWTTTNPKNRVISNLDSPFAIVDSDWAGRVWMNEQIITRSVSIDASKRIFLAFDHYFKSYGSEIADVDIKVDSDQWKNILSYQYQDAAGFLILPLNPYINKAGTTQIQIRWNYQNAYDAYYWAIDNIRILQESGIPKKGDLTEDGTIDISDVILCLRMSIGLDPMNIETADMNSDGVVDISDVILILRKAVGLD
ncbi:MAG TPA: clostripain-related cysteine peptidase [bacterium]|nr:clostripain-related cysteine peptidase [bacterium]HOL35091.1 clostripain-related cysteine peptidase [bacterium]HPP07872.1 clostripain-related cysteine peptidase [bacterium]